MNEMNYWKQFYCTGKVEDYLKYKQCREDLGNEISDNNKVKEERSYAGFYHSDGNRYKD